MNETAKALENLLEISDMTVPKPDDVNEEDWYDNQGDGETQ